MSDLRTDWPGRPTRFDYLRPRGLRERIGAVIAKPLLLRYDRELGAETMRADSGWESCVEARRLLRDREAGASEGGSVG